MKVKDLKFVNDECSLMQFVFADSHSIVLSCLRKFLITKVNSRHYRLFAQRYGYEFPMCNFRVFANDDVCDLIREVYNLM